jgi:hypothetical protein
VGNVLVGKLLLLMVSIKQKSLQTLFLAGKDPAGLNACKRIL